MTTELLPTGLLPAMSRDLGVSEGRLGLLVTAYALMVAVLAAPIGMATARVGRRSLLTVALVGYAMCNVVTAVSDTYLLTVAGRLVGGMSHGLFWGMLAGYAGRLVSPDRVGRAVTITSTGGTASILIGVPAGTAIGVAAGWRAVFLGFAVVAAALAVVGSRLLPPMSGTTRAAAVRLRDVIRMPGLAVVVTATALIMLGHFSFITYFLQAATLHAAPGAADPASALNASAFNVGIGGGALLGGLTLDQWGAQALPLISAGLAALGLVAVVLGRRVGALPAGVGARIV